jgi:succinate dehydrogenase hydrophobic anchor subunit
MKETPKNKSGRHIPPVLLIWLALFVIIIPIEAVREFVSSEADSLRIFLHAAIGASLYFPVLGVWWLARRVIRGCSWRRVFISLAAFVLVIAIGYGEEDWRGKHAWNQCKRELEAQGEVLDWDKYIPPPVPDDQNFFKAPKMAEWFVGRNTTNDLYLRLNDKKFAKISSSVGANNLISSAALAQEYLAWSDQFKSDFDLIREALKRPYARMDGDYSRPFKQPIPNFVAERQLAQMLAQRTHSYLLLN